LPRLLAEGQQGTAGDPGAKTKEKKNKNNAVLVSSCVFRKRKREIQKEKIIGPPSAPE